MIINREWAMPDSKTFRIKPISDLIDRHICKDRTIDPFANENSPAETTNDIDPQYKTTYNMDALDFLRMFTENSIKTVLFDPPYSSRQVSECYKKMEKSVNMETTSGAFWGKMKKEVGRITALGGKCITCGWNSGGIGEKYGFEIEEILLVAHGGWHNDTIVTVEKKIFQQLEMF